MNTSKAKQLLSPVSTLLAVLLLVVQVATAARTTTIKFATVAPRNSAWMNSMLELDQELQLLTDGAVRFKFYPGGVQGDEKDVLRKIRIGQLHAAGFTGVGMGAINSDSRILDLPFLFKSSEEVDLITNSCHDEFVQGFRDGGFELLGWTEVGLVRFFTVSPISSVEDLQQVKLWVWQDDPLARIFFQKMGLSPIPLSLTDVLSSLETGLINAAYASPYAGAVLQWHTRIDHVSQMPVANATGAILISQECFNRITAENQAVLLDLCARYAERITLASRQENNRTLELFREQGIIIDPVPVDTAMQSLQQAAAAIQQELAGELYDADLFMRIEQVLREHRGQ